MKNIGKSLIELGKSIQKIEKEGCPVQMQFEIINTGIVDNPIESEYYRIYMDLEGRDITIRIIIPNKSIGAKLKELNEKDKT